MPAAFTSAKTSHSTETPMSKASNKAALGTSQSLDLTLKQTLTLTPQLQQAIKILNMSNLDLNVEISNMLAQNIMLERKGDIHYENPGSESDSSGDEGEDSGGLLQNLSGELEYDSTWEEHYDHDWKDHAPYREEDDNPELYLSAKPTLVGYLEEQINQMPLDESRRRAALAVVFELDEDGYFRSDVETVAALQELSVADIEEGIRIVQQCQPGGVGARNLEECLNIQIAALPPHTPYLAELRLIMERHYNLVGRSPLMLRQRLGMDIPTYNHAMALLRSLDPRPGQQYNENRTQYIDPDVIVREKNGISYIDTGDAPRPDLGINQAYAALAESAKGADKTLLQAQLQEARWFLNAIDKRADTIRRVAGIIVALQQEFFQEGESAMRPLTRQKVAEMLDIHESTVSRAVNDKYLLCKRGIYELRYFFSNQMESTEGEDQSVISIKAMISEIISEENSSKPYSDQKISEILAERGHKLARRTVTKYRESLGIPTTSLRRYSKKS